MNSWVLLICLSFLTTIALFLAIYPLRKTKKLSVILPPLLTLSLFFAYQHWGAWREWQSYLNQQRQQAQVQAVLQSIKNPQDIVERLKSRLQAQPESAKGWYLLGRLHASQGQWVEAKNAFERAHLLDKANEATTVNYAQSLWQLNHQQFNPSIHQLFTELLEKNPNQVDALAMLAMEAFMVHDYQLAIDYWQRLLKLAAPRSNEAQAIQRAIAKAQQQLSNSKDS